MTFRLWNFFLLKQRRMVRAGGIEPPRDFSLRILSPVRLPVPPCPLLQGPVLFPLPQAIYTLHTFK